MKILVTTFEYRKLENLVLGHLLHRALALLVLLPQKTENNNKGIEQPKLNLQNEYERLLMLVVLI